MSAADDRSLAQWVALSLIPHLGSQTISRLLDRFGSLEAVLGADAAALQTVYGIGPRLATAIGAADVGAIEAALASWLADGIAVAQRDQPGYPVALQALPDAPPVLFWRGALAAADQRAIAIVGTRRPTVQARQAAEALAAQAVAHGWTVVSGLAVGVDALAHRAALARGGRTLAVLGSGVRAVYPPTHRALAAEVMARGALLSETHPDASPSAPALVARNRIISGLSRAVIVVEAGADSGSLHAARFARAQGRPVLAVRSAAPGNARLLAEGASTIGSGAEDWASVEVLLNE
jgi:DNA processing protein